jgi:hypothetical protein
MDEQPKRRRKKNAELEEAKEHGGYSLKDVLGTVATVDETKRRTLLNLLMVLEAGLPSHLQKHYLPREGQNPYESADCIIAGIMQDAAMAILAAQEGEDRPDTVETMMETADQLCAEVYELMAVHKRNAMREATRQMFGGLLGALGGLQVFMMTEEGPQPLDMRDEPT